VTNGYFSSLHFAKSQLFHCLRKSTNVTRHLSSPFVFTIATALWANVGLAQRDLKDIPTPDPKAELAAMLVDPNLEVNLYASDPSITKPIHMNFDEKGRLWVATSEVYPQILPGETANDKVVVLEDKDGDGVAETSTVFADNLLIPTGILPGDGGVYIANSTDLIHLSDSDGDGKADKRRVVLSGFGTEDTHHLLHTLRWGPDGRMYLNQSIYIHSHIETPYGVKRLDGGGIWRYEPRTEELEVVCRGLVNPWGHIFDRWGQSFATDGAGYEGINYVFPESVFMTSPGATRWLSGLNPGSPKHCGLEIISGSHFPPEYQDRYVTNDFRSHRVCMFEITRTEEGYVSTQHPEIIRSQHTAFRPIDVKMGPDGAIYVADWYNPIIQHGEVDFRDPRRDRKHGRIWRISYKGRPAVAKRNYAETSSEQLIEWLEASEEWVRQWSRQELKNRPADRIIALTKNWIESATTPEQRDARLREAIWLAVAVRRPQAQWVDSLRKSPDARQRSAAVRAIGWNHEEYPQSLAWLTEAIQDADWQVRLEGVASLDKIGTADALAIAIQAADKPLNNFIDFALWSTLNRHEDKWLPSIANTDSPFRQPKRFLFTASAAKSGSALNLLAQELVGGKLPAEFQDRAIRILSERADPATVGELLRWLIDNSSDQKSLLAQLQTLKQKTIDRNFVPNKADESLKNLLSKLQSTSGNIELQREATSMIGTWKLSQLSDVLKTSVDAAVSDKENLDKLQSAIASIYALGSLDKPELSDYLNSLANNQNLATGLRGAAALSLATKNVQRSAQIIVAMIAETKDGTADIAPIDGLLGRQGGPAAIQAALNQEIVWSPDSSREVVRRIQAKNIANEELIARVQAIGKLADSAWKFTPELVKELTDLARSEGDATQGEQIYRIAELQCVRCHAIGPAGGQIGPNLVSLGGSSAPDYIIESLLAPDAKMKEGFQSLVIQTDDGEVLTGLQRSRNDEQIELLLADGRTVKIATSSIEAIREGKSIMPAGLVDRLNKKQLVHLVRFLTELGRNPAYSVGTEPIVRSWQSLQYSQEAHTLLNRTSVDAVATQDSRLNWADLTSLVNGSLPTTGLPTFQPHRDTPATAYVRFAIEVQTAGSVQFVSNSTTQLPFYVDGQPKPYAADMNMDLGTGIHWIVIGLPKDKGIESLKVQVQAAAGSNTVVRLLTIAEAVVASTSK
jgi:putative heme-binding domain-containing protein